MHSSLNMSLLCAVVMYVVGWMDVLDPPLCAGALRRNKGDMHKAGRTCGQHSSTAVMRCHKIVDPTPYAGHTGCCKQQLYYNCSCQPGAQHVACLGGGTANPSETALNGHACSRKGSSWQGVLYGLCDAEQLIELYAVEAHSLDKPEHAVVFEGLTVCPASNRENVIVAAACSLVIKVNGQGHSTIVLTHANSCDSSLAEMRLKDQLYAQEVLG